MNGGLAKSNPITKRTSPGLRRGIERGPEELPAGGPDVLTRGEMNALAFAAVGSKARSMPAPLFAVKAAAFLATPFQPGWRS